MRAKRHLKTILNRPSVIDEECIDVIPQKAPIERLNDTPSLEETIKAISKLNNGKAPGVDTLNAELFKFGGHYFLEMLTGVIQKIWKSEVVPKDWNKAAMEVLFKNNGRKDDCNNFLAICMLATAGKLLSRIMLDRLQKCEADEILPESQSGLTNGRSTVDMVLQEKCVEQQMGHYQVFIDLTRAFASVSRTALWEILKRVGCPEEFLTILKQFHDDMEVRVNIGGNVSESISVVNGVKQDDKLALTLLALYFPIVFQ